MGWKTADEAFESAKGGKYTKFENDGDKYVLAFPWCGPGTTDDPHVEETIWNEKTDTAEPYTAEHKAAGKDPSHRFLFGVFDKADQDEPKILTANINTAKLIKAAVTKYHEAGKMVFLEIKRHGKKGDKKTKYSVLYDSELSTEDKEKVAKLERPNFTNEPKGATNGAAATSNGSSNELPKETRDRIAERIKSLPNMREAMASFLKEMGADRLSAVKASDAAKAETVLAGLEGKKAAPAEAAKEVDPFS